MPIDLMGFRDGDDNPLRILHPSRPL